MNLLECTYCKMMQNIRNIYTRGLTGLVNGSTKAQFVLNAIFAGIPLDMATVDAFFPGMCFALSL